MATAKKLDSLGFRVSPDNKEIIRMAASFTGHDLTSYVISTVLERAKEDIIKHKELQSLLLSDRDFDKVTAEMSNPSAANSKLKKAFAEHSEK